MWREHLALILACLPGLDLKNSLLRPRLKGLLELADVSPRSRLETMSFKT